MRGKGKKLFLILFMTFIIIAQGAFRVNAAPKGNFKIIVSSGFNGSFKYGYDVPVNITIENKEKDINGELQICAINGDGRSIIYAKSLSLPKNSTKNMTLNVPIMNASTKYKIALLDGKNKVYEDDCSIQTGGASQQTVLIGVLSDEYDSVSYINRVSLSTNSTVPSKTVKIDEKNFPEDLSVIRAFDVIVINNFDTTKLNKDKYENLKKWVNDGGLLIIGTGATYSKTLGIFKDDFITGKIENVSKIATTQLSKLVKGNNVNSINGMELNVLNLDIKGAEKISSEGNTSLIQRITKEKGAVIITAFDLGLNPISTWEENSILGDKLIGFSNLNKIAMMNKGNIEDIYSVNEAVSCNSELPVPKINNLLVIIIIYIILAGPISYIILKKLDKRGYMWLTVPALSMVFAAIMYVSGNGTRMTNPVANIVSMVDLDENGYVTKSTYGGIFTPGKGDLKIQGEAGIKIYPFTNEMFQNVGGNLKEARQVEAKVVMGTNNYVQYYNAPAFSNKVISIEDDENKAGKLEMLISFTNNRFSGTIKNNTGYDLVDCNLINGNAYIPIASIKNGETKKIDDVSKSVNLNQGPVWQILDPTMQNRIVNYGSGVNMSNSARRQYLEARQKSAIARAYMNNRGGMLNSPMFFGWSSTAKAKKISVNNKSVMTYEKTLLSAPLNLSVRNGNKVEYPYGYIKPVIGSTTSMIKYDNYNNKIFGQGSIDFVYKIDNNIKIEKIQVAENSYGSMDIKLELWNNENAKWEEGDIKGFTKEGDILSKYIDQDNNIKIRIERINDTVPTDIPQISVKGSVK